jgi:CheY-like chemotaxis protein
MGSKSTVLVVEDEQLLLDIVALELEDAGFAVLQAETGEDAISLLQGSERIDLLLTDIRLPGQISGWTVAERARSLSPHLPVIYVTGYSNEPPRRVSGSILLMKPYLPSAIVEAARQLGVN